MSRMEPDKEDAPLGRVAIGRMFPPVGNRPAFETEKERMKKSTSNYLLI